MGKGTDRLKLIIAFASIYLIWGSTYLGIRFAIETIPAIAMAGLRFLIAGALFMIIARFAGAAWPTRRQWRHGFIVGTLMLGGGTGTVTWAEQWVPSGLAALLVASAPLWIVLADWFRPGGVRPGVPVFIGLVIGFVGVAILLDPSLGYGSGYLTAAVALIFASFLWAVGSIMSKHTDNPDSQIMSTGLKMLLGGVSLAIVAGFAGEWAKFDPSGISWKSGLALAYLITIGSSAFVAYLWLLKASTPAKAATYAFVNPAVAVMLGTLLAGEPFTLRTALASVVIVSAVVLVVSYRRAASPVREPEQPTGVRPAIASAAAGDSEAA